MKLITLLLAMFLFFLTKTFAQTHIQSRNCEIFIDKTMVTTGPHGGMILNFFVKTINSRLDGEITEVGFRFQETVTSIVGRSYQDEASIRASRFFNSQDYFLVEIPVSHSEGCIAYRGSFYAKTSRGTFYWLNTVEGGDFKLNKQTFAWILNQQTGSFTQANPNLAVATQKKDLDVFNPHHCY